MMIFPKKTPQDRAPEEAASARAPAPPADDSSRLPDSWRVVLEDGSTSGEQIEGPAPRSGRKLMAEVTDAIRGRSERKTRASRPRNIAMPPSSRPPLQALDQAFVVKSGRSSASLPQASPSTVSAGPNTPRKDEQGRQNDSPGRSKSAADLLGGGTDTGRRDLDARLARIIDLWPRLPRGIQAAIMTLVDLEAA